MFLVGHSWLTSNYILKNYLTDLTCMTWQLHDPMWSATISQIS